MTTDIVIIDRKIFLSKNQILGKVFGFKRHGCGHFDIWVIY